MNKIRYAQIAANSSMVKNVIIGSENFTLEGFTLISLDSEKYCEPGMYYDNQSNDFYFDKSFTQKTKIIEEISS